MSTPEQGRQLNPKQVSTSKIRPWMLRVLQGFGKLVLEYVTYCVILALLRVVESIVIILLLIAGTSVALTMYFLIQSSGMSRISWFVFLLGLPISILLFKVQFDSEQSSFDIRDRLKKVLSDAKARRLNDAQTRRDFRK